MSLRHEFVALARQEDANIQALCRRYGISAQTGSKWLNRAAEGQAELIDRSRRPRASPTKTAADIEAQVVALRQEHPTWGGRKIAAVLARAAPGALAPSTVTTILHRHGLIVPNVDAPHRWQRFEHAAPNDLWQLDFMGHRPVANGQRARPLTVRDEHSRFAVGVIACPHEQQALVQTHLTACLQRSGLPDAILTDKGPPWGTSGAGGLTALEAWLLRLGVAVWHSRAYHPQTQGKVERCHGTIAADVFAHRRLPDRAACQPACDAFRAVYNQERPHQALAFAVPASRYAASRYAASPRPFPARLPEIVSGPDDQVRVVRDQGAILFRTRSWFISRGLSGLPAAVRPTTTDGHFHVFFCRRQVATRDRRAVREG